MGHFLTGWSVGQSLMTILERREFIKFWGSEENKNPAKGDEDDGTTEIDHRNNFMVSS